MRNQENLIIVVLVIALVSLIAIATYNLIYSEGSVQKAVYIIEDNTTNYVTLTEEERAVFKSGDIIWVDTDKHIVSDSALVSFKAIIK